MLKKRLVSLVALATAATLSLSACGGGKSSSSDIKGKNNGVITAAVAYETKNFDPIGSSSALALGANWHVMEGLYELDMHNFKPYAALAKEEPKKVSDTVYEIALRDGAKFSDGAVVKADDVVKSAQLAMENGLYKGFLNFIDKVEKKNDTTVTFTLKFPFSLLKNRLALIKMVKADSNKETRTKMPVGTGPWMYKSIDDKQIVFVPNPNYNGKFPAKAKEMKWSIIKDDVARTTAMQGNTVDVMESVPFKSSNVLSDAGAEIKSVQGFNLPFLMFNTKKAPFDKKEVRQAFFYAINSERLVKGVMNGQAEVATSFLPKNHANYHQAKVVYKYDPNKAKELLKASGVEGITLTLVTTDHPWVTGLVPQIKQDLEAVGIKVNVTSMKSAALYSQHADTGNYDVALAPGDPSVFGNDPDLLINWWYGPGPWTDTRTFWAGSAGYKLLHEAMDKAVRATGEQQQAEWNKAFDILSDEVPLYPLFHRQVVTGFYGKKLNNYEPIGTTGLNFIGVEPK